MRGLPVFLAALALTAPAAAFDDLWQDLAIVGADPTIPHEAFTYGAPDFEVEDLRNVLGPANRDLSEAMIEPDKATAATGVDFSAVTAVFETGMPPDTVSIIHGPEGFAANAPATLAARDFTSTEQNGFIVLSKGDDQAIDFSAVRSGDPFMAGMGKSYRLAVGGDFAVLSYSTAQMAALTAAFADPATCTCGPWRDLVDAVRGAAGSEAVLEAAAGYPAAAIVLDPPRSIDFDRIGMPQSAVPAYSFMLFAMTRDAAHHPTLFIGMHFADGATANAGAETAATGIQLFIDASKPSSPIAGGRVVATLSGPIVTLTVTFNDPAGAPRAYSAWTGLIMNRAFRVLTPA